MFTVLGLIAGAVTFAVLLRLAERLVFGPWTDPDHHQY